MTASTDRDTPEIDDGCGGVWATCGPDCDLQVVRPGKVQCNRASSTCPDAPQPDSLAENPTDPVAGEESDSFTKIPSTSPATAGLSEAGEADRQREARDRWIGIAQQFHAKAEDAEQEAATLRAQVAAVECVYETALERSFNTNDWTSDDWEDFTEGFLHDLRAALDNPAPVVQRIKDEAAATELAKISAELYRDHDMPPRKDSRSYQYRDGWWDGVHHAAKVVEQRARRVRDGEPT